MPKVLGKPAAKPDADSQSKARPARVPPLPAAVETKCSAWLHFGVTTLLANAETTSELFKMSQNRCQQNQYCMLSYHIIFAQATYYAAQLF